MISLLSKLSVRLGPHACVLATVYMHVFVCMYVVNSLSSILPAAGTVLSLERLIEVKGNRYTVRLFSMYLLDSLSLCW